MLNPQIPILLSGYINESKMRPVSLYEQFNPIFFYNSFQQSP